ncbi:GIY-YIG nuclease family protein [Ancylomarina sp. 16SWW S1-10-2]|uniref:GIY-YIG nuclease family protein n=1 Tax=Ancylomarina sp. 16SWW S1-10-2 TaxID=2499681 RepID=UPI0012ADBB1E|nr:GIY-YIG nuclease family protein [Ancylomarina sp. 16SWW S1-10-2]MRT94915.1 GIY-YIG nuclease family protein [Ancylomarina sp. 16SWW S1-10-2]
MEIVVYILYSKSVDRYYVGCSKDFEQRLLLHNDKVFSGSYSTRAKDWGLFYKINCISIAQARRIESHIKSMKSRVYIENLLKYADITKKLLEKYK